MADVRTLRLGMAWIRGMAVAIAAVLGQGVTSLAAAQETVNITDDHAPRFLLASNTPSHPLMPVDIHRTAVLRRRISVALRNVPLEQALKTIAAKSGLDLAYSRTVVPLDRPVHLEAREITTAAALIEVLFDTGIDVVFSPSGRAVLVRRSEALGTISGRVIAAEGGKPIVSAQVSVQGTQLGAITDDDGRFRITGVEGQQVVLQVRRLGFRPVTQTVLVGSGDVVITMIAAPMMLEGVVVTGTPGETQKRSLGNSIVQVDAVQLRN